MKPNEDERVWSSKHSERMPYIYKETWTPFLTEHLECKREEGNDKDRYAIAVLRHDTVVGHIARRISAACTKKHLGAAGYHGLRSFHQKLE